MDLINRQDAIDACLNGCCACVNDCVDEIEKLPSAQKTGKWIDGTYRQTCSICRYRGMRSWRFCPICGARMVGEEE